MKATLAVLLMAVTAGCSSSSCKAACTSATALSLCVGDTSRTLTCKGPAGCAAGVCDTSTHTLGDDCADVGGLRCDPAMANRVLVCEAFKLGAYRSCSGPRGCYLDPSGDGGTVGCDFTIGDSCPPSYEGRYACDSVDNTQVLECVDGGAVFYEQCGAGKTCGQDGGALVCQ